MERSKSKTKYYTNNNKIKKNQSSKVNVPTFKCEHRKCRKREWVPFECNRCSKSFCLKHRSPDAHKCTMARVPVSCSKQAVLCHGGKLGGKALKSILVQ